MPTIKIECSNCGNEEETTLLGADDWCQRCPFCTNDACPHCADKEHDGYHKQCWQDENGED